MGDSTWFLVIAIIAIALQGLTLFLALFEPGLRYKITRRPSYPLGSEAFCNVVEALADSEMHSGTRVEVLTNGNVFYEAELEAIHGPLGDAVRCVRADYGLLPKTSKGGKAGDYLVVLNPEHTRGREISYVVVRLHSCEPQERIKPVERRLKRFARSRFSSERRMESAIDRVRDTARIDERG